MADKEKFLATFRINQDEWKDFMAQAKAEGLSASAVLVDFIQWYRAGNRIAADTESSINLDNLTVLIDERIKAKLSELVSRDSQAHENNLDTILDERDRQLESRILSTLVSMLETLLEELQGNIRNIELALDKRIEKLELSPIAAPTQLGDSGTGNCGQMEVEMQQQELEQLVTQIEELQRSNVSYVQRNKELQSENESLLQQNQELQQELNNLSTARAISLPDLQLVRDKQSLLAARDRILKSLITGKGKVATTSPQYKTAARALDRFIDELQKSTPVSTHEQKHTPESQATWEDKAESFLDEVKWNE